MLHFTWSLDDPPTEPPAECHNPELWAEMRGLWGEHQLKERDGRCACGERWPCAETRIALRGLMNACTPLLGGEGSRDLMAPTRELR
jgi:hypothetical protein